MHFINFKGTAWGHGRVIGTCSHSIFYISCVEKRARYHPRLPVATGVCIFMQNTFGVKRRG